MFAAAEGAHEEGCGGHACGGEAEEAEGVVAELAPEPAGGVEVLPEVGDSRLEVLPAGIEFQGELSLLFLE